MFIDANKVIDLISEFKETANRGLSNGDPSVIPFLEAANRLQDMINSEVAHLEGMAAEFREKDSIEEVEEFLDGEDDEEYPYL